MAKYFADTFALVEYIRGSKEIIPYFEKDSIFTTKFNLMELYYSMLNIGSNMADHYYDVFLNFVFGPSDETIKNAMKLRLKLKNQKRNLSYADALGYQISLETGVKFLSGDKEFKGMKNVEFVK